MPTAPGTAPVEPVIDRGGVCRRFARDASSHPRQAASRAARHRIVLPAIGRRLERGSLLRSTRGTPCGAGGSTSANAAVVVLTSAQRPFEAGLAVCRLRTAGWGSGRAFIPCFKELALRVLMLAAPGAGKGTQGGLIAEHFGDPHIATGDLLRDHVSRETDLGQQVKRFLDKGDLVPDGIVLDMVRGALGAAKKDSGGYVLDGLPRTMEQARAVYQMTV